MFNSLWPHGLHSPCNSPGQNTGVDSLSLLQGIFQTQGSNPGLLHYRQLLYHLNHQGSPRILEWVAYPFSSGSCWPKNRTGLSCIAGRFFTSWATRKAQGYLSIVYNDAPGASDPFLYQFLSLFSLPWFWTLEWGADKSQIFQLTWIPGQYIE